MRHNAAATVRRRQSDFAVDVRSARGAPFLSADLGPRSRSPSEKGPASPRASGCRTPPSLSGAGLDTVPEKGLPGGIPCCNRWPCCPCRCSLRAPSAGQSNVGPAIFLLDAGIYSCDSQRSVTAAVDMAGKTGVVVDTALEAKPVALIVDQIAAALETGRQPKNPHAASCGPSESGFRLSAGDNLSEYMFYHNHEKSVRPRKASRL